MNGYIGIISFVLVCSLFSMFYYIGVSIRNYKETDSAKLNKILFMKGLYGLIETLIINFVIFEVIFEGATTNLDIAKQLLAAMAICLRNGYSYKETLASIATHMDSSDGPKKSLV